ncbi:MAG: alginate export family protein [Xanthomonadaceae bacterium]|nr:alginate export family protein [Xanthomonadaceae bacterium]
MTSQNYPRPVRAALARVPIGLAALALIGVPVASAQTASPWRVDLRYRFEQVDDDALARDAKAHTVRLRVGYQHSFSAGWRAYLEGEHVESLNGQFNSTANGKTGFPVVADPEDTELNQAWLGYAGERIEGRLGRQRILIDNHRFLGNVGWRQNEQTYDAVWLAGSPLPGLRAQYGYLNRVHRVFSDAAINPLLREREHDSHFVDLDYAVAPALKLGGYVFLLKDEDAPTDSSSTWGVRAVGSHALNDRINLAVRAEYARQSDYRNQPLDFGLDYWRFEPSVTLKGVTFKTGWERLDGDGSKGFATPLATLHAFNGWADRFLATPADGLDDRFVGLSGTLGKASWAVVRHEFDAARGSADYGYEWDASLSYPLPGGLTALVKLADYQSDGFATDVSKFWFQLEYRN